MSIVQTNIIRFVTPVPGKPDRVLFVYNAFQVGGQWRIYYTRDYRKTRKYLTRAAALEVIAAMPAGVKKTVSPDDGITTISDPLLRLVLIHTIDPTEYTGEVTSLSGGVGVIEAVNNDDTAAPYLDVRCTNTSFIFDDVITVSTSGATNEVGGITPIG